MEAVNNGDLNACDREPDLDSYEAELCCPIRDMGTTNLQAKNQLHVGKPKLKDTRRITEKGIVNGGYSSFSSRNKEVTSKLKDREPGELSSESGSDDIIDSETRKMVDEVEGNGFQAPAEKKRKFSPIVWDRDDKESLKSLSARVSRSRNEKKNSPPALLKSCLSTSLFNSGAKGSPVEFISEQDINSFSPDKCISAEILGHDSVEESLSFPTNDADFSDGQEMVRVVEEDYVPTINISSSRWVADDDSPVDEGEILCGHDSSRGKNGDMVIPDLGEPNDVDSNQSREKLSESDGDEYCGDGSDEENNMDVDEEHQTRDGAEDSEGNETEKESQDYCRNINMLMGCRNVDEFERLNKIDEGTYGVVYRAKDRKTGEVVALKKVKMEKEREGFPLTSLREINILLSFHHPSIVDVKEVVVGSNLDSIFMVMEYMEHDLKGLMESMKQPFSQSEVKCLMLQLLSGVKYLHDNWVLHRDLKTSNLLLNNRGELKICDFGLSRQYGSPLKPYTHLVVTLWYRAPELLLGTKQYSTAIDMWSLGCIMAELLSKEPLFNGKTELDQIDKIFRILGTPNEAIWPGYSKLPGVKINFLKHQYNLLRKKFPPTSFTGSPVLSDSGFDLLNRLLAYDPERRISAEAALNHEWFREVPLPKVKEFMPTFPAQHAQDRRLRRALKSPDPLEEQRLKELRGEFGSGGLFG